ncbi:MAG: VWA domain-containing protein [Verrucomicrobia bacterium]|nr:VWA domain-containing protein [Verrucomicrobiota bacterium]
MTNNVTELRFIGEWNPWAGLLAALVLAAVAWIFYWRETRTRTDTARWLLPTLRALVVFFIVMMLTGPVLHHRKTLGQLARVLLFVDASESMGLTDEQMELPRKLFIAQQLGWLPPDKFDADLQRAGESVGRAQRLAASAKAGMTVNELKELAQNIARETGAANDHLGKMKSGSWPNSSAQISKFQSELLATASGLGGAAATNAPAKAAPVFTIFSGTAWRWEKELNKAFTDHMFRSAAATPEAFKPVEKKFDAATRWQRLEALLFSGNESFFSRLAAKHNVELSALAARKSELLWWPGAGKSGEAGSQPQAFKIAATNHPTDLADAIKERVQDAKGGERVGVVLFSDGQHNDGSSPVELAKMLGQRGIPIYTVGLGMQHLPQDLAIIEVKGPESLYADARVNGEIVLKDDVRPGLKFTVKIECEGEVLWQKDFVTEQRHSRTIRYDFSIKEFVAGQLKKQDKDIKISSLPVNLKVSASVLDGEKNAANNNGALRLSAITQKPRVLLMDGRPRWEFRYLRNLFERDQRWDLTALLAGLGGEQKPWIRGKGAEQFPPDRETLFTYDLIIFGDLPQGQLKPDELEWIREFVEKRGGGLIFIDGRLEQLSRFTGSPLEALFPVKWQGQPIEDVRAKLRISSAGAGVSALNLVSDPQENARLWLSLKGPHWVAPAEALPGTETLMEAFVGERRGAALAFRRFGAGRVLYAAFDESWRWRYEVADLYHQKVWNQIAKWIMDEPYPVQDKFVALDSGALTRKPDEIGEISVRVRDAQGQLMSGAKPEALLFQNGRKTATVALAAEETNPGVYRGRTPALAEGGYEVRVQVAGLPEDEMKARTEILVAPPGAGELAHLNCDEELLRQIAFHSGGEYYREEDAGALVERLKPLSQGIVIESDTALWQSWWWFVPIVALLTIEWLLRKRAGLL